MTAVEHPSPLVTIVMPVHNGANTLRQSVISVLDQTFTDFELIIINDASTDGTAQIAEELAEQQPRVRVIHCPVSGGPASARNAGIAEAQGRFLAFCDADDLWLPTKLQQQLSLARTTGAALIYGSYHRIAADYEGGAENYEPDGRAFLAPPRLSYGQLLGHNYIGNLTALVDRSITGDVHMPDLPGAEDWALWLAITREHGPACGVEEPVALYRTAQPTSHSANRTRAIRAVWTVLRKQEQLSIPVSVAKLINNVVAALRKSKI